MTEADTESIWGVALDTTRFGKIGVRIAEVLNFWINGDATSQVTNTAVTPLCEQLSEEALIRLIAAAQINSVIDPSRFIQANVVSITSKVVRDNKLILDKIKIKLEKKTYY